MAGVSSEPRGRCMTSYLTTVNLLKADHSCDWQPLDFTRFPRLITLVNRSDLLPQH